MAKHSPDELNTFWPELREEIEKANSIVVTSHVNPDGDAYGSVLGFSLMLDGLGIDHDVVMHHEPPRNLRFLPGIDRTKRESRWSEPDLLVILDLEATSRLGSSVLPLFEKAKRVVVIDHHVPHEQPGDLRIVSTKSPATAAILNDLFVGNVEITADMATNLMTGIVTDTGSFKYPNTTSHCLHVSAALLEAGANLPLIIEEVYMTRSLSSAKILGHVLAQVKTDADGKIAWAVIPQHVFEELGATDEDTEGIVNEILSLDGVLIAAILRESVKGKIRGSLRSRGKIDVARAAREFGGGGHENAAGVTFEGDVSTAERSLVEVLRNCLE